MTNHSLLGFALVSLALLHCSRDEQSLGANSSGASQAGTSGSSGQAGAAGAAEPGGQAGVAGVAEPGGQAGAAGIGEPGGQAGAAGAGPVRSICDGSDGLTFGFGVYVTGTVEVGSYVQHELGSRSFYIDGHCRFWATTPVDARNVWQPIHEGVLTAAQAQQLALDAGYDQWPTTHGGFGAGLAVAISNVVMFDRQWSVGCGNGSCAPSSPPFVLSMGVKMPQWNETLYAQGTPVTTPMRVRALALEEVPPAHSPLVWHAPTDLDSVLFAPATDDEFNGDAPLLTDPADLAALRQLRADVLALPAMGGSPPLFYVRDDLDGQGTLGNLRARVFFRDTIPLENAQGLIELP